MKVLMFVSGRYAIRETRVHNDQSPLVECNFVCIFCDTTNQFSTVEDSIDDGLMSFSQIYSTEEIKILKCAILDRDSSTFVYKIGCSILELSLITVVIVIMITK